MRIYMAGPYNTTGGAGWRLPGVSEVFYAYPYMLESFYYINKPNMTSLIRATKKKLFLDSGAYSAFTMGASIKVEAYAQFIKKHADFVEFAANLDHITSAGYAEAARVSDENFKRMRSLLPSEIYLIPVYHIHEPLEYLERMVKESPFIAIGGMVKESSKDLARILDELWDRVLTDREGRPRVRVHGFGLTTYDLMLRYPWWSVDSTSWVMGAAFGSIRILNSSGEPITVSISGQSPKRKDIDRHYDSLSPIEQKEIERLIVARGFTLARLRGDGSMGMLTRAAFNIDFHRDLMDRNAKTFKKATGGFFE